MTTKIALSAGHHNTTGGDAREQAIVGPVTRDLAAALRQRGFEVRVITPREGMGTYPASLTEAARVVVDWATAKWVADLFMEIHGEAVPSQPSRRGCFAIYPDWAGDLDATVRNTLGPLLANAIKAKTNIPLRGAGVMSEKQTHIGSQGSRLGIFAATVPIRTRTRRMILEIGTYTNGADLAIMQAPGFSVRIADGLADALAGYYGVTMSPQLPAGFYPVALTVDAAYKASGGVWRQGLFAPGYATTPLFDGPDGHGYQLFERTGVRVTVHGSLEWLRTDEVEMLKAWRLGLPL